MNKNELVNDIAQRAAISKKDAGDFLDAFTKVITERWNQGKRSQLSILADSPSPRVPSGWGETHRPVSRC